MLKIAETTNGLGLITTEVIKRGEDILVLKGEILNQPTKYSIQIAKDKHILNDLAIRTNHSCMPNSHIHEEKIVALKDIGIDEEITFDYNSNEDIVAYPFTCSCCNKLIIGKLAVSA